MKTYFNVSDGSLIKVWVSALTLFFTLNLTMSIFGPIMRVTLASLVDQYAFQNAALLSAKSLILLFFSLFPFAVSLMILVWAVLSSLKREEDRFRT